MGIESKPKVYYTDKHGKERYKILDPHHVRLLHLIYFSDICESYHPYMEDLQKALGVKSTTLSRYMNSLTKTGLIERKRTPDLRLAITDKGRAWCEEHFSSGSE